VFITGLPVQKEPQCDQNLTDWRNTVTPLKKQANSFHRFEFLVFIYIQLVK